MWPAIATSMAVLVAAQAPPDAKAEKAAEARTEWVRPTRIRLDFRDRPLAEIVNGINAQGPSMLGIRPEARGFRGEAGTEPPPHRYSLVEGEPVTFWQAVDRVGRAAQTWPVSGNRPVGGLGILLAPASADRGFATNDGAFRVVLTGTSYVSHFQFAPHFFNQPGLEQPRADGSSRRPVVNANLMVMAEPRLQIIRPVELVVREAADDRGRSLIPAVPWRESLSKSPARSYPNQEHVWIRLEPLDDPGKQIKRLAGSITLEVSPSLPGSPSATAAVGFDFADVPLP